MGLNASIQIKGNLLNNKTIFDLLDSFPLKIKLIHDGELIIGRGCKLYCVSSF